MISEEPEIREDCAIPWGTLGTISFVPLMDRPFPYKRNAYWQTDHWVGYVYQQDMVMTCPWCGALSRITFQPPNGWTWNGDYQRPTVSPSVLVLGGHKGCRMHIFIRDGRIVDAGTPWHEPRRVDNDH